MESALGLLRLALDRSWAVAAILIVFFGGVLLSPRMGMDVPSIVKQWSSAGLLFGVAALVVSVLAYLARGVHWLRDRTKQRRAEQERQEAERRSVIANIGAMDLEQAHALLEVLTSGASRFSVHIGTPGDGLRELGLIRPIRFVRGGNLCELHPALEAGRQELAEHLRRELARHH